MATSPKRQRLEFDLKHEFILRLAGLSGVAARYSAKLVELFTASWVDSPYLHTLLRKGEEDPAWKDLFVESGLPAMASNVAFTLLRAAVQSAAPPPSIFVAASLNLPFTVYSARQDTVDMLARTLSAFPSVLITSGSCTGKSALLALLRISCGAFTVVFMRAGSVLRHVDWLPSLNLPEIPGEGLIDCLNRAATSLQTLGKKVVFVWDDFQMYFPANREDGAVANTPLCNAYIQSEFMLGMKDLSAASAELLGFRVLACSSIQYSAKQPSPFDFAKKLTFADVRGTCRHIEECLSDWRQKSDVVSITDENIGPVAEVFHYWCDGDIGLVAAAANALEELAQRRAPMQLTAPSMQLFFDTHGAALMSDRRQALMLSDLTAAQAGLLVQLHAVGGSVSIPCGNEPAWRVLHQLGYVHLDVDEAHQEATISFPHRLMERAVARLFMTTVTSRPGNVLFGSLGDLLTLSLPLIDYATAKSSMSKRGFGTTKVVIERVWQYYLHAALLAVTPKGTAISPEFRICGGNGAVDFLISNVMVADTQFTAMVELLVLPPFTQRKAIEKSFHDHLGRFSVGGKYSGVAVTDHCVVAFFDQVDASGRDINLAEELGFLASDPRNHVFVVATDVHKLWVLKKSTWRKLDLQPQPFLVTADGPQIVTGLHQPAHHWLQYMYQ